MYAVYLNDEYFQANLEETVSLLIQAAQNGWQCHVRLQNVREWASLVPHTFPERSFVCSKGGWWKYSALRLAHDRANVALDRDEWQGSRFEGLTVD